MGPFRRGLILTALAALPMVSLPRAAWADTCAKFRPDWDGTPVTAMQEAVTLMMSPAALFLILATALAFRLRRQWLTLTLCVGWSALVAVVTFLDLPGGSRQEALAQGCMGAPSIFIALSAAICVALAMFAVPSEKEEEG